MQTPHLILSPKATSLRLFLFHFVCFRFIFCIILQFFSEQIMSFRLVVSSSLLEEGLRRRAPLRGMSSSVLSSFPRASSALASRAYSAAAAAAEEEELEPREANGVRCCDRGRWACWACVGDPPQAARSGEGEMKYLCASSKKLPK